MKYWLLRRLREAYSTGLKIIGLICAQAFKHLLQIARVVRRSSFGGQYSTVGMGVRDYIFMECSRRPHSVTSHGPECPQTLTIQIPNISQHRLWTDSHKISINPAHSPPSSFLMELPSLYDRPPSRAQSQPIITAEIVEKLWWIKSPPNPQSLSARSIKSIIQGLSVNQAFQL